MARYSENQRIEQFERACRERGWPVTAQRRTILDNILDREDHPTADQVYDQVRKLLPTISRTTVYRILDGFVELGIITKICHPGSAARFDPKIHQHHHLVCLCCNNIIDLEEKRLNKVLWPDVRRYGFEIRDYHIHFRGICAACRRARHATGGPRPKVTARRRAGQMRSADKRRART
jgi:Fur family transcriptional regulator, peroxide stress response regulator